MEKKIFVDRIIILSDNEFVGRNVNIFEEENIIRSILSLGPYVKVISPKRIVDEIIIRISKAIDLGADVLDNPD